MPALSHKQCKLLLLAGLLLLLSFGLSAFLLHDRGPNDLDYWQDMEVNTLNQILISRPGLWAWEVARIRVNTLAIMLFGRPTAAEYVERHCRAVKDTFMPLVQESLQHWEELGMADVLRSPDRLYLHNDRVYWETTGEEQRMMPSYYIHLNRLRMKARLPDLSLPINPADEPQAVLKDGVPERPLFGYCRDDTTGDILIPNMDNGNIFLQPRSKAAYRPNSRAGPNDPRQPRGVWRGSLGGEGGMTKGRLALLKLGLERPDLVDIGLRDWNETRYGPHKGRVKPSMSLADQIDTYKYMIWVPGNCAAIRLPSQLVSDAAVLMLDSPEIEWFYPLLRPYEHYIPVTVKNESFVDVESAIKWAESHPLEVRYIVARSTRFAEKFLNVHAIDCYYMQLLEGYRRLFKEKMVLPSTAQPMRINKTSF